MIGKKTSKYLAPSAGIFLFSPHKLWEVVCIEIVRTMTNYSGSEFQEKAKELLERGYRLQQDGRLPEAISLYKYSLEIHPTPEAHTYLGWAYSADGDYERAVEECKRAVALDPELGSPYNDIGAYLTRMGKYEEAEAWFHRALKAPRYDARPFAHLNLGRVYQRQGKWFEAIAEYRRALECKPDYKPAEQARIFLQAMMN